MSAAMRALVTNLDRTIRRFSQLSGDVGRVSEQITGRSRHPGAQRERSTRVHRPHLRVQ